MPITTLINNFVDTSVEVEQRITGFAVNSVTRDIRSTGQDTSNVIRDLRATASASPLTIIGPLGTNASVSVSNTFSLIVPFITAGSHVILAIVHASGGDVSSVSDTKGNIWTIDQPSIYNGSTGLAVVSAPILISLQAGDQITITWTAPIADKAVTGQVVRGLLTASYVDVTATNTSSNYSVNTGTTALTTGVGKELVFGAVATGGTYDVTFVPDPGFTGLQEANSQLGNVANKTVNGASKIVSVPGTYNVTGTLT